MKKIKKFKIPLRKKDIIGILKISSGTKEITPQLEELVINEMCDSKKYLSPRAIFDTFKPDELAEAGEDMAGLVSDAGGDRPGKVVAVSLCIATIGDEIEARHSEAFGKGEVIRAGVIDALGREGRAEAMEFICRILKEEAQKEECELLPAEGITGAKAARIAGFMSGEKINVSFEPNNTIHPSYTSVFLVKWKPRRDSRLRKKAKGK